MKQARSCLSKDLLLLCHDLSQDSYEEDERHWDWGDWDDYVKMPGSAERMLHVFVSANHEILRAGEEGK